MLILRASTELRQTFDTLLDNLKVPVQWTGIFAIENEKIVLMGTTRSLVFYVGEKRADTNIIDLRFRESDVLGIAGNLMLTNTMNMLLYIFGKWGAIRLKVDREYSQLNMLFNVILKSIGVTVDFNQEHLVFSRRGRRLTYEDVVDLCIHPPEAEPIEEGGEHGLWHDLSWDFKEQEFDRVETTVEERLGGRIGDNFYTAGYLCPKCRSNLFMTIFHPDRPFSIDTKDGKVLLARAFTCDNCHIFYTPVPRRLICEGIIYEMDFEDDEAAYKDYRDLLGRNGSREPNSGFNRYADGRDDGLDEESIPLDEACLNIEELSDEDLMRLNDKMDEGFYSDDEIRRHEEKIREITRAREQARIEIEEEAERRRLEREREEEEARSEMGLGDVPRGFDPLSSGDELLDSMVAEALMGGTNSDNMEQILPAGSEDMEIYEPGNVPEPSPLEILSSGTIVKDTGYSPLRENNDFSAVLDKKLSRDSKDTGSGSEPLIAYEYGSLHDIDTIDAVSSDYDTYEDRKSGAYSSYGSEKKPAIRGFSGRGSSLTGKAGGDFDDDESLGGAYGSTYGIRERDPSLASGPLLDKPTIKYGELSHPEKHSEKKQGSRKYKDPLAEPGAGGGRSKSRDTGTSKAAEMVKGIFSLFGKKDKKNKKAKKGGFFSKNNKKETLLLSEGSDAENREGVEPNGHKDTDERSFREEREHGTGSVNEIGYSNTDAADHKGIPETGHKDAADHKGIPETSHKDEIRDTKDTVARTEPGGGMPSGEKPGKDASAWEADKNNKVDVEKSLEEIQREREDTKVRVDNLIKTAPKKNRGDLVNLVVALTDADPTGEFSNKYIPIIKDKIKELDRKAIASITDNIPGEGANGQIDAYMEIMDSDILPELKEDILGQLGRRIAAIKGQESELLCQKLKKDFADSGVTEPDRHHYYMAKQIQEGTWDEGEVMLMDRAIASYGAGMLPFEYPVLIVDTSRGKNGKSGMILTPDHIFTTSLMSTEMIDVPAIEEIEYSGGLFGKSITCHHSGGLKLKLPFGVKNSELEDYAGVLDSFVTYLQSRPDSRNLDYLSKAHHDKTICFRCGFSYDGGGECPRCGYNNS